MISEPVWNAADPRCLFVICNDYGELGVAMCALAGQEFAGRSTILLPPRLIEANREGLPGRVAPYRGLQDLLDSVDRDKPDVVLLLSGYLFSLHRNLSLRDLAALVETLRRRRVPIVTSDPFLGLVSEAEMGDAFRIEIPGASWFLRLIAWRQTRKLIRHLSVSGAILRDVPHLYPVYPPTVGDPGHGAPRRISFYNERLIAHPAARRNGSGSWLFVLGAHDYELQASLHGESKFLQILRARLDDARHAGRRAVFVGPERCVQKVAGGGTGDAVDAVSFCPYGTFTSLLLEAEYAFYWNVVSYSNLLRLVNGLPSFSFDVGHVVRNVKPLYGRVVQWYYQGSEPVMLDSRAKLELSRLAGLAVASADGASRFRERLGRSPGPGPMLRQVMHG